MREILFRGKDIYGKWLYGDLINLTKEIKQICNHNQLEHAHSVNPETIGQYTGLTDKNGTKIFEGDIIKSCEYDDIYFVKYCAYDNYPAFDVVPEMNIECNGLSHLHIVEGIEVIGNIHDNPELMKGGE